jgi:hypothetical protein
MPSMVSEADDHLVDLKAEIWSSRREVYEITYFILIICSNFVSCIIERMFVLDLYHISFTEKLR